MAKRPEPGSTKTRLVPHFSPEQAAELYECLLRDVLDLVRAVPGVTPLVAVSPADSGGYFRALAPDFGQVVQVGDSLGARLDHVLSSCLADGYDQVAAVGSDVPTLPSAHLAMAFDLLADPDVDVVIGPSEDGGYHLIGWKRRHASLVLGVEMSTPDVAADTLAQADAAGLRVATIPTWYDVDRPEDLDRVRADATAGHTFDFLATP